MCAECARFVVRPAGIGVPTHGRWAFRVDAGFDPDTGRHRQILRQGFATKRQAESPHLRIGPPPNRRPARPAATQGADTTQGRGLLARSTRVSCGVRVRDSGLWSSFDVGSAVAPRGARLRHLPQLPISPPSSLVMTRQPTVADRRRGRRARSCTASGWPGRWRRSAPRPGCWMPTNIVRSSGVTNTPVISQTFGPTRNRRVSRGGRVGAEHLVVAEAGVGAGVDGAAGHVGLDPQPAARGDVEPVGRPVLVADDRRAVRPGGRDRRRARRCPTRTSAR